MYWNKGLVGTRKGRNGDKLQHEMYWNHKEMRLASSNLLDKLQHEMYWNIYDGLEDYAWLFDKLQHEMYWNEGKVDMVVSLIKINYNMRCIEMYFTILFHNAYTDKLQHEMYWNPLFLLQKIFDIYDKLQHEMYWNNSFQNITFCSIWDKLQHEMYWNATSNLSLMNGALINYNMRCIEILTAFPRKC